MSKLNPQQQLVVDTQGHLCVVAGPGAGKTSTTVQKIAAILRASDAHRVAAVSFTRDSALELKDRATKAVGESVSRCLIGTFHSLCSKQLKVSKQNKKLLLPAEQTHYQLRAFEQVAPADVDFEEVRCAIEHIKSTIAYRDIPPHVSEIYNLYQQMLQRNDVMDMQDLIRNTVLGLHDGTVRPLPVTHLLIDEFQDSDEVQLEWVLAHAKAGATITVVGDDDQSIYGWRHALGYRGMQKMVDSLSATTVILDTNYRSFKEILDPANLLIAYNKERVQKVIRPARGEGGSVSYVRLPDRGAEAKAIAERIENDPNLYFDGTWKRPKDGWSVLARNNHLLRFVEAELSSRNIACRMSGSKKSIWEEPPLLQYQSILRSICECTFVGVDQCLHMLGVNDPQIASIHEQAGDPGALFAANKAFNVPGLDKAIKKEVDRLLNALPGWRTQLKAGRVNLVLDAVASFIRDNLPDKKKQEVYLGYGINTLRESLRGPLLDRLRVVTKRQEDEQSADAVVLMSIHGSKGLEWTNVWVMGLEDSVLPSGHIDEHSTYDEERRLFYVAMTRAKNHLYVSSTIANPESFFVKESGLVTTPAH